MTVYPMILAETARFRCGYCYITQWVGGPLLESVAIASSSLSEKARNPVFKQKNSRSWGKNIFINGQKPGF